MMGLFVMAALMGFQSIPIGQAVTQELTDSFSDLSRIAETKSYGDLYFFNFVPNGASHSVNEITYDHGQEGGNVSWSHSDFGSEDSVNSKIDAIIKGNLQPRVQSYFNARYGGDSSRGGCEITGITYTTKVLPTPEDGNLQKSQIDFYENNIPVLIRSEVETSGEPAPIQANCLDNRGDTKYIGDTGETSEGQTEDETDDTENEPTINLPTLGNINILDNLPWETPGSSLALVEPYVFDDFTSVGYTNEINATGNRYHRMTGSTATFFDNLYGEWTSVEEKTGSSGWTCSLGSDDYQEAVSEAENQVSSDISDGKSNAEDSLSLPGGIEIQQSTITSSDELSYDVTANNFEGEADTWSTSGDCVCDCGKRCCNDEKKAHAEVTPVSTTLRFTLEDTRYKILTEDSWKNLEFHVENYNHNFENDD